MLGPSIRMKKNVSTPSLESLSPKKPGRIYNVPYNNCNSNEVKYRSELNVCSILVSGAVPKEMCGTKEVVTFSKMG